MTVYKYCKLEIIKLKSLLSQQRLCLLGLLVVREVVDRLRSLRQLNVFRERLVLQLDRSELLRLLQVVGEHQLHLSGVLFGSRFLLNGSDLLHEPEPFLLFHPLRL